MPPKDSVGPNANPASAPKPFAIPPVETPWPEPVSGSDLLGEIVAVFNTYLVLPAGTAVALALWCLHTYVHDAAEISPVLMVISPERRCGKTTLLLVLRALVRQPVLSSNVTPAVLYRMIERFHPTLLIDEGDTFLHGKELNGLLNSGHMKAVSVIHRSVPQGDDWDAAGYSTWAPKAIAAIQTPALWSTLLDRSIVIKLRRRKKTESVKIFRPERYDDFKPLRERIVRWAADSIDLLRDADPAVPDALHDRAADNWRPLFAIADACGETWATAARDIAVALTGSELDALSPGEMLLCDLDRAFRDKGVGRISTNALIDWLTDLEDRPWEAYHGPNQPITPHDLGTLLRPYGIKSTRAREGRLNLRGYELTPHLVEVFDRYIPRSLREHLEHSERSEQTSSAEPDVPHVPDDMNGDDGSRTGERLP